METRIRTYIDGVFRDVPVTERSESIKSEILQNLLDRYRDLLADGRSEEEAYAMAISSGGDLSGIAADLKGEGVGYSYAYEKQFDRYYEKEYRKEKKKCAIFNGWFWPLVVCVYLCYSFLVSGAWSYSWILFIAASAVSNLYAYLTIKSNRKERRAAAGGAIWTGIVTVYFVLSFLTRRWDVTWLVFILGVALSRILSALEESKNKEEEI